MHDMQHGKEMRLWFYLLGILFPKMDKTINYIRVPRSLRFIITFIGLGTVVSVILL